MKKILISSVITVISVLGAIAQPMPNQNPHNNPGASTSAPTTSSISTLSVDHNEMLMIALTLLIVGGLYIVTKKKSIKA